MSFLNTKYTFERFVVGPSNRFSHAASIVVAEQPAKNYNPLFIYGGYGLGKTHLLHAIGLCITSSHPKFNILYVSGEEFMNEMISAIRYDRMPELRQKYRNIDCLLIDDIHVLSGMEGTQEELFHTFNILHDTGKQIVMTSDKFPKDIDNFEERLRSRFEWGLITDIQPPEIETRIAIIKSKIQEDNISITDDIAYYIALHVKSNIGELKSILGMVNSYSSLTGRKINLDLVKEVIKIAKINNTWVTKYRSRMFSIIRSKRSRKKQ